MRTTRTSAGRSRGFALLLVLLVLAVITVATAALYTDSENALATSFSLANQQVATTRAEHGLQVAIARLRSPGFGGIDINSFQPCDPGDFSDLPTTCPTALVAPTVTGPAGVPPAKGGGLLYGYILYARQLPPGKGNAPLGLVTIRATGYFGTSLTAPNLTTSVIEADITPRRPPGVECKGDGYECG